MQRNNRLISKKVLEFFLPTVLTAMATNFAAIVDAGIVGHLIGSTGLSVINILLPVIQIYAAIGVLFGIGGSVIIASSRGRDGTDRSTGNKAYTAICLSLPVISAVMMAVQLLEADGIVALLTPVQELQPLVKEYYLPFVFGTPMTLMMSCLVHILRTDNRPKYATWVIVTANTVNLILDVVFIKCFGLGLTGASLATVAGNAVGLAMVIAHFKSEKCTLRWDVSALKKAGDFFRCFADLLKNGTSGAIGMILTTGKLLFLNLLIQYYGGTAGMVAFSAVSLCLILESAFVAGGCQTMVPIISLLFGEKDYNGIRMTFRKTVRILTVSCIAMIAVMELFPQLAAIIYGIEGPELPLTLRAIRISVPMILGDALTFLFIYMYMCTENKLLSTMISVLNGIVLIIPMGMMLAKKYGIDGVWMALTAAQYAALALTVIGASAMKKRKKADDFYLLDRTCDTEVLAFSTDGGESSFDTAYALVSSCTDANTAGFVCDVLRMLAHAGTQPRKNTDTDIRVCNHGGYSVWIKSNAAGQSGECFSAIAEKYPGVTCSEAVGFLQITMTKQ